MAKKFSQLLFAALFVACAARASPPTTGRTPTSLHVGQILYVRLAASPATGYGWAFVGPLPPVLRMEGDPGLRPLERTRPGAPALQTWTFRAQQPGRAVLRFVYRRPWEPDAIAADRREVEVVVE